MVETYALIGISFFSKLSSFSPENLEHSLFIITIIQLLIALGRPQYSLYSLQLPIFWLRLVLSIYTNIIQLSNYRLLQRKQVEDFKKTILLIVNI